MRILLFLSLLFSTPSFAELHKIIRVLSDVSAAEDATQTIVSDTEYATSGSYHCVWADLTTGGALDGHFDVETSSDAGVTWVAKSGATILATTADGESSISLNGIVTEARYRIKWVDESVTGGTVNCYAIFKG